ncbi:MAG: alpha-2-macroglobulin family protein, partial [Bacteroidia bacterium]
SGYPNTNYLFELEHKGEAVSTKTMTAGMNMNEIIVDEAYRGNFAFHLTFVKNNRFYSQSSVITVPYTNKELDIQFETFRNKLLPGQQEEWKLVIKDKKGDKMTAELMTAMYDASLDAFRPNYWAFNAYNTWYSQLNWNCTAGSQVNSNEFNDIRLPYSYLPAREYDHLNYFGVYFYQNYYYRNGYEKYDGDVAAQPATTGMYADEVTTVSKNAVGGVMEEKPKEAQKKQMRSVADAKFAETEHAEAGGKSEGPGENRREGKESGGELGNVKARSNFNETAFFYPSLQTNEKGETVIKFTIPESLTKWKVMGLAHTKDLKIGQFQKDVVTQKDLMVQPNAPRFFREGDKMTFISKVANLSDKELQGSAELKLYDALTDKEISASMIEAVSGPFPTIGYRDFTVKKGQSTSIEWNISIPQGYSAIKYKIVAKAGSFTDGEETAVPVLTNRMLVTESMPLPIRSNQTKDFTFEKFVNQNNNSTTLKNHAYTLEFTANPAWYAVQALPYLMEYPYECAEQTFARYYANSLASHVANSKPKIKAVFEAWKTSSPAAFLSNLEKNQELKAVVLEETPWVLQSKSETENKKRIGLLFDLNRMGNEQASAFRKLLKAQTSNGGFWWFEGGPDDWYITQHIACGFGHLDKLGVLKVRQDAKAWDMLYKAVRYCDNRMREEYEWVKKYDKDYKTKNHLSSMAVQYLYMRSFFKDIDMDGKNKEHFEYYKKQEQTYWVSEERFMQGMIALNLFRYSDLKTPKDILKSLKENSINSEEMGMYWKENYGFYWYQAPIEQQAIMIEAFDEINNDTKAVDDLKTWLIKSKQTQNWETTRATTEAVYALLLKGTDWLSTEPNVEITVGDIKLDPKNDPDVKVEPGTGYFKKTWTGSDIKPAMGKIKIEKKDQGVSWGAVYWQYFEQLDKITPHETPLKLKKQLFLQKNTISGPVIEPITSATKLKLGDKIKVRIELRVDREMDYVHMKDMRAAGFEPTNVFSGYKWQDGLGYYESTKDAATNFFFSKLTKGTYVFEYPVVVNHYGDFSNGITQIQCMYAPEFTSHSEGIRVKVAK